MADTPPLVMIEWVDGRQPMPGWQRLSDLDEHRASRCVSVGFLVRDDEHTKVIAPNLNCSGDSGWDRASGLIAIPKAAITSLKTVSAFHLNIAAKTLDTKSLETKTSEAKPRPVADAPWLRRLA